MAPIRSSAVTAASQCNDYPLAVATSPRWVEVAAASLDALLLDHAHCELKAAASAVAMAGRFAEEEGLVRDLTALAREELRHFELVHARLRERGCRLVPPRADRYVQRLSSLTRRPGAGRRAALLDQLILCGFIEARSGERFRLLARGPLPPELRSFYAELAGAEARHATLFIDHACRLAGEEAERRILEVARIEAAVVRELPLEPRMH